MLKPAKEVWVVFNGSMANGHTCYLIQNYLTEHYPEANWVVTVSGDKGKIDINATFKTPVEETFYLLKWS